MSEQWSCGHEANGMCAVCYYELAGRAHALAERATRMEKALRDIEQWSRAYPLTVFPEPDMKKAAEVLRMHGMTVDAISASAMRHVLDGIIAIVKDGLNDLKPGDEWYEGP